jgi:release factor glutamine methyltransferase
MKHAPWNIHRLGRGPARGREKQKTVNAIAIDSSEKALAVAKRNAIRHGVPIQFLRGNLLEPLAHELRTMNHEHLIITANLPYLTPEQYAEEPSIQHEPTSALVGGKTGLELYEQLLKQMQTLTAKRYTLNAFFEIDPSQSDAMRALIKKYLPNASVEIKKDLCGRDRVVSCVLRPDLATRVERLQYPQNEKN